MTSILVPLSCIPGSYLAFSLLQKKLPVRISFEKSVLAAIIGTVALAILLAPAKIYASLALLAGYTILSTVASCVGIYLYCRHVNAIISRGANQMDGVNVIDVTQLRPERR